MADPDLANRAKQDLTPDWSVIEVHDGTLAGPGICLHECRRTDLKAKLAQTVNKFTDRDPVMDEDLHDIIRDNLRESARLSLNAARHVLVALNAVSSSSTIPQNHQLVKETKRNLRDTFLWRCYGFALGLDDAALDPFNDYLDRNMHAQLKHAHLQTVGSNLMKAVAENADNPVLTAWAARAARTAPPTATGGTAAQTALPIDTDGTAAQTALPPLPPQTAQPPETVLPPPLLKSLAEWEPIAARFRSLHDPIGSEDEPLGFACDASSSSHLAPLARLDDDHGAPSSFTQPGPSEGLPTGLHVQDGLLQRHVRKKGFANITERPLFFWSPDTKHKDMFQVSGDFNEEVSVRGGTAPISAPCRGSCQLLRGAVYRWTLVVERGGSCSSFRQLHFGIMWAELPAKSRTLDTTGDVYVDGKPISILGAPPRRRITNGALVHFEVDMCGLKSDFGTMAIAINDGPWRTYFDDVPLDAPSPTPVVIMKEHEARVRVCAGY